MKRMVIVFRTELTEAEKEALLDFRADNKIIFARGMAPGACYTVAHIYRGPQPLSLGWADVALKSLNSQISKITCLYE